MTITVWKDGTWKVWRDADAAHAANDPDFLVNIPVSRVTEDAGAGGTDAALAALEAK